MIRGSLDTLRAQAGQFQGTVEACLGDDLTGSSLVDPASPNPGSGLYYLVRGAGPSPYCNAGHSWRMEGSAEQPGAGGDRDADLALDPEACP